MECPVVAPRLEDIRDLVTDGRDGLLFMPEDADNLTDVLRRSILGTKNWRYNADRVLALVARRLKPPPANVDNGTQHA